MTVKIISDIVKFDKNIELSTENIENLLTQKYGNILRWAITMVEHEFITITFTYEKTV